MITLEEFITEHENLKYKAYIIGECTFCNTNYKYEIIHGEPFFNAQCHCAFSDEKFKTTWKDMYQDLIDLNLL